MNVAATVETMKTLRAQLLTIEASRSAAAAMLKVAGKSESAAVAMTPMIEAQLTSLQEALKTVAALTLVQPAPAPEPEAKPKK